METPSITIGRNPITNKNGTLLVKDLGQIRVATYSGISVVSEGSIGLNYGITDIDSAVRNDGEIRFTALRSMWEHHRFILEIVNDSTTFTYDTNSSTNIVDSTNATLDHSQPQYKIHADKVTTKSVVTFNRSDLMYPNSGNIICNFHVILEGNDRYSPDSASSFTIVIN